MAKATITVFIFLSFISITQAAVYKYVDKNGRITFSDTPMVSDVEEINLFDSRSNENSSTNKKTNTISREKSKYNKATVNSKSVEKSTNQNKSKKDPSSITARDYDISTNISEKNGTMFISGRVRGGPQCASLSLDIFTKSKDGGIIQLNTFIKNAGGFGSKTFEAQRSHSYASRGEWYVDSLYAKCR